VTVYLDASALVKLLVREPETDALRAFVARFPSRATSIVGTVEMTRALLRQAPERAPHLAAFFPCVAVIAFDHDVAVVAGRLAPSALRALDAVHLASAMALGPDLEAFVTYDARLAEAAATAGLAVVVPA
jgi:predicted nucleic acid-binding protein